MCVIRIVRIIWCICGRETWLPDSFRRFNRARINHSQRSMQPKPMFFSFFHWYICVSFFISSQNATNRITNVYCFVRIISFIIAFSSFVSTESTRRKIQRNRKTNWERDSSIIYLNLLNSPKSSAFWLSRKEVEKKCNVGNGMLWLLWIELYHENSSL